MFSPKELYSRPKKNNIVQSVKLLNAQAKATHEIVAKLTVELSQLNNYFELIKRLPIETREQSINHAERDQKLRLMIRITNILRIDIDCLIRNYSETKEKILSEANSSELRPLDMISFHYARFIKQGILEEPGLPELDIFSSPSFEELKEITIAYEASVKEFSDAIISVFYMEASLSIFLYILAYILVGLSALALLHHLIILSVVLVACMFLAIFVALVPSLILDQFYSRLIPKINSDELIKLVNSDNDNSEEDLFKELDNLITFRNADKEEQPAIVLK